LNLAGMAYASRTFFISDRVSGSSEMRSEAPDPQKQVQDSSIRNVIEHSPHRQLQSLSY
jgi:hypothetical protein